MNLTDAQKLALDRFWQRARIHDEVPLKEMVWSELLSVVRVTRRLLQLNSTKEADEANDYVEDLLAIYSYLEMNHESLV